MTGGFLLLSRRFIKIISLIVMLVPVPAFAQNYDGPWTVTRSGNGCQPKSPITVIIKDGEFSGSYSGGTGRHTIKGAVAGDGNFAFTAKSPRDRVEFQGDLTAGTGKWKARNCNGTLKIFPQ